MLKYVSLQQKSRTNLYKKFIGLKVHHILEEECRYMLAKWEQKTREKTTWQQFIEHLRFPTKKNLMELLLHKNAAELEAEFIKHKGLSESFIDWMLSIIITNKMLMADISIHDQQSIENVSIVKKVNIDFNALKNYSCFDGMVQTNDQIEFIYFQMSYPGFMNVIVCLEAGLALYYFPKLKKLYFQE